MKANRRAVLSTSVVSALEIPMDSGESSNEKAKHSQPVSAFEYMFEGTTTNTRNNNQENHPPLVQDSLACMAMGAVLADSSKPKQHKKGRNTRSQPKKQLASSRARYQRQVSNKQQKRDIPEKTAASVSAGSHGGLSSLFDGGETQQLATKRKANLSIKQPLASHPAPTLDMPKTSKQSFSSKYDSLADESVLASMKRLSIGPGTTRTKHEFGGLSIEQDSESMSKSKLTSTKSKTSGPQDAAGTLGGMFDNTPSAAQCQSHLGANGEDQHQFTPKNKDRKRRNIMESSSWKISSVALMDDEDENSSGLSVRNDGEDLHLTQHTSTSMIQSPTIVQPSKRTDSKITPIKCLSMEMNQKGLEQKEETENKTYTIIDSAVDEMASSSHHNSTSNPLIEAIQNSTSQQENMKPDPCSQIISEAKDTISISIRQNSSRPDPSPTPLFFPRVPPRNQNTILHSHERPDPPAINIIKRQIPIHLSKPLKQQQARDPTPCKAWPIEQPLSAFSPEESIKSSKEQEEPRLQCQVDGRNAQKDAEKFEAENARQSRHRIFDGFVDSEIEDSKGSQAHSGVHGELSDIGHPACDESIASGIDDFDTSVLSQGDPSKRALLQGFVDSDSTESSVKMTKVPLKTHEGEEVFDTKTERNDVDSDSNATETLRIDDETEPDAMMESIGRRTRKQPTRFGHFANPEEVEKSMRRRKRKPRAKRTAKSQSTKDAKQEIKPEQVKDIMKSTNVKSTQSANAFCFKESTDEDTSSSDTEASRSSDLENDWSDGEVAALRKAHGKVEPTSSFFWDRVSSFMIGRTGRECSDKWFSLVATPKARQSKNRAAPFQSARETEMDDFNDSNSSPSILITRESLDFGSPIKIAMEDESMQTMHIAKPALGNKKYVNDLKKAMRQDRREGRKKRAPKKKPIVKKRNQYVSESLREGDLEFQAQMTPGGTLEVRQVNSPDDFWDDAYGLSDQEEDDI